MNIDEVKSLLKLTSDKHDQYIDTMLPILIEFVKDTCNNQFTDIEPLPGPVRLFIAKAIEFNMNPTGVTGRSMGSVTYSYDLDFPASMMRLIKPYKRLRFHA